ncbi:hypothetical protein ACXR6G_19965 [Ancylomarina sp. YFZ004]
MKKHTFLLIALFFLSNYTFSQTRGVTSKSIIDFNKVYNKHTGEKISKSEFHNLHKANPNIVLEQVIDKYGEIESRLVDPFRKDSFQTRDISKRAQNGESFPPFVMKSITNRTLKSEELNDRYILIQFQLSFLKPFFNKKTLNEFNELVFELQKLVSIEGIVVTESSTKEIKEQIGESTYKREIIPNGRNFNERYLVVDFPSMILVDKNGDLISYYKHSEIDKVISVIKKLK